MGKSICEVGMEDLVIAGLPTEEAMELQRVLKELVSGANGSDPREVWRELVARRVLKPWHPHGLHRLVYSSVYANWDASTNGPPPYWFPSPYDFCSFISLSLSILFHASTSHYLNALLLLLYLRTDIYIYCFHAWLLLI